MRCSNKSAIEIASSRHSTSYLSTVGIVVNISRLGWGTPTV
jgi:hypothetical protein